MPPKGQFDFFRSNLLPMQKIMMWYGILHGERSCFFHNQKKTLAILVGLSSLSQICIFNSCILMLQVKTNYPVVWSVIDGLWWKLWLFWRFLMLYTSNTVMSVLFHRICKRLSLVLPKTPNNLNSNTGGNHFPRHQKQLYRFTATILLLSTLDMMYLANFTLPTTSNFVNDWSQKPCPLSWKFFM